VIGIRIGVFLRPKGYLYPDSEVLEKTWTLIPISILLTIAYPRVYLLCVQDANRQAPVSTIKIVRNQWNWQREVVDVVDHLLDSDRVEVIAAYESPVLLKRIQDTRVITVRTDVLHSLGLPRLGVKLDASPGRIRTTIIKTFSPGVYLGSCYELCGRGHRAMPIHILAV